MNNSEKKLFLIDAMALIYRAYFALNKSPRINSKGLRLLSNKYIKISNDKDVFTHILLGLRRDFVNSSKKET